MNKITIAKKLFKLANNLDEYGYFEQANKLTKIAADLNEYEEKDYDLGMNYDFEDLDDTVDGTITSLNSDKNFGVMETEDGNRITFRYDPEEEYHVFETEEFDNLQVGYLVKVHLMHKYGEPGVLYIIERSSEFNKPFGNDFGAMSMGMPESNMSRVDAISRPQDNLYTSRRDFS